MEADSGWAGPTRGVAGVPFVTGVEEFAIMTIFSVPLYKAVGLFCGGFVCGQLAMVLVSGLFSVTRRK